MNVIQKVEHWGDIHHAKWLDVVRIALGLLIFLKGISFIADNNIQNEFLLKDMFGASTLLGEVAIHTVAFVHLVGGILITIGLVTRFAVVIQIPILICAVFFVNITNGFSMLNSELWLSILVLILLILFWVIGSGPYSVDHFMSQQKGKRYN